MKLVFDIETTGEDFPVRNNVMIRNCDLAIIFSGRLGVWGEVLSIVNDYHKRIIIFEKEFENIKCLKKILKDTGKNKKVRYVKSVSEIKKIV